MANSADELKLEGLSRRLGTTVLADSTKDIGWPNFASHDRLISGYVRAFSLNCAASFLQLAASTPESLPTATKVNPISR